MLEFVEQPVLRHAPQEDVDTMLRKSIRMEKSATPSDYIAYLQGTNCNVGTVNNPDMFSQARDVENPNADTMP